MHRFARRPMPVENTAEGPPGPSYLAGHILTEAIPSVTTSATRTNQEDIERTAHEQRQSIFLRLPTEVRLRIYDEVIKEAGLTQHIYVKGGRYTHTACITNEVRDDRQTEVEKIYSREEKSLNNPLWSRRLLSSWANHWRCEEAAVAAAAGPPVPTPFLPLLLCCKRV